MSVISAADVEKARQVLIIAADDVVTPLARDRAKELGIRLERAPSAVRVTNANTAANANANTSTSAITNANSNTSAITNANSNTSAITNANSNTSAITNANSKTSENSNVNTPRSNDTANVMKRNRVANVPSWTNARPANTYGGGFDRPFKRNPVASNIVVAIPSAAIRAPHPGAARSEPRSGALYRRGGPAATAPSVVVRPTVAVVGAGHVGAAAGIRLAESDVFECVKLIDVVDGLAAGLALDMWHSAGLLEFTTRVVGSADIDAVAGADIVVITAGRPRQPGMTRTDLTAANAEIVRGIATAIRDRARHAVVVVVTNPLEEMTHLVAKITGFSPERVIGMGGVLDTARFCSLVGLSGIAKPEEVHAIVLGSHGAEMVIPLSQATANGIPLEQLLDTETLADIVRRTRDSGAEVTGLLKAGSAHVSPGSAIARQVEAIASGSKDVVPACVASGGAYGIPDVRVGLPVRLGPNGVREIVELELRPAELRALREAAEQIRARTVALNQLVDRVDVRP